MQYKTIIQGRLAFGNEKSFSKALKMYNYRKENYHKSNVLFEAEEIFDVEKLEVNIPRFVKQIIDKPYKNTMSLLEYCAQFAVDGYMHGWLLEDRKILNYTKVEPISEKIVVKQYQKGKALVKQKGKEQEALDAFNAAIEKYDQHAQAYERRGKVNYTLKKYHDAKRDYNKSIAIDATNPHPFFGRAKVHKVEKDLNAAVADLEVVLKLSVALQPIYWKARRMKGVLHFELQEYDKAIFDLKLFSNRVFEDDNPNYFWNKYAHFHYALVLKETEDYEEAINQLNTAIEITDGYDKISEAEILRHRGVCKQKSGKNGFIKDLKEAIEKGDKHAKKILDDHKKSKKKKK